MGHLPQVRVKPSKPFTNSGVDYSGPFYIKQGGISSKTLVKCYVALFICLATKAIHVELVTDLSTEAYIASLRLLLLGEDCVRTFIVTMVQTLLVLRKN